MNRRDWRNDPDIRNEHDRLATIYRQRGLVVLIETAADELVKLRRYIADHRCALPDSIQQALNSGDGSYRP